MKLRVLGCAGAEFPNFHPPAFLIDDCLLLDAGTIGAVLTADEQWSIRHILVTHSHLDHIRGIPALADNIIVKNLGHSVEIAAIPPVIDALRIHLMNNVIWPDFSRLPSPESAVIRYHELVPEQQLLIGPYRVTTCLVNHAVPAAGFVVRTGNKGLLYTGDTGPTNGIWQHATNLSALIVEVSFPNEMEETALLTGHLTAKLLHTELGKAPELPQRILITHPKPQYVERIRSDLAALDLPHVELLVDGAEYNL